MQIYTPYKHPTGKRRAAEEHDRATDGKTLQIINLSTRTLTKAQLSVLGRGFSFSPAWKFDSFTVIKDVYLFARKLAFKKIFHDKNQDPRLSIPEEQKALMALQKLLVEQETEVRGRFPSSILPTSTKFPNLSAFPNIQLFVQLVSAQFQKIPMI